MIWQNPSAWLGLASVAIPVLIHLLGRDKAPRRSFPSLRFIEIAELPPTRRTRLHDLLLLATRVAIFAFAVAALAQPLLLVASRRAAIDSRIARAIIIDTSASMQRQTPSGGRAIDSARSEAQRIASDAQTSVVVETAAPGSAISGAIAWLESQPSRRELVIVSDFQTGTVDSTTIAGIPSAIGIRAIPISAQSDRSLQTRSLVRDASIVAHVDVAADPTVVSWRIGSRDSVQSQPRITFDAKDRASVEVLTSAARTLGVAAPVDTLPIVTVVFADAPDRTALIQRSARVSTSRLGAIVARLRSDPMLASARGYADVPVAWGSSDPAMRLGPVVMDVAGIVNAIAAEDTVAGAHRLLVFSYDSAASVRSAMLLSAIRRALSIAPPVGELDPTTTPSAVIASWRRAPSTTPTRESVDAVNGPSDARWLWAIVLLLLAVEALLRRERASVAATVQPRTHDRAA